MTNSSLVVIFLGYVLWVEFVGGIVYRNLINDNPRKDGLESNYFNKEKTMNETEDFDRLESEIDFLGSGNGMIRKGDEEQANTWQDGSGQDGLGEEGSGEKTEEQSESESESQCVGATKNGSVVEGDKTDCTCGEKAGVVETDEDGSANNGQDTQTERTDVNGSEGNMKDAAVDEEEQTKNSDNEPFKSEKDAADNKNDVHGKDEAENKKSENEKIDSELDAADGRVEDEKTLNGSASGENEGIVEETSTDGTEENQMDKNQGNGFDTSVQTFRFSPLNR